MASRNLPRFARLLLVCLLTLAAGGVASAAPDYKDIKKEISKLETSLSDAVKAENEVTAKLDKNRRDQAKADGAALAALKKEAKTLSDEADKATTKRLEAQRALADKRGELRAAAAKYAVSQINGTGNLDTRVAEAKTAVADWDEAIGTLPDVPETTKVAGIVDPLEKAAAAKLVKGQLDDFDNWAAGEIKRVDTELDQVKKILDAESQLKNAKGGPALIQAAKDLKKHLNEQTIQVGELRAVVKSRRDGLK
ncbi:MAG: hypothetical protein H6839_05080 [Planctomycetes bacterium]|nr:hypothetical protein [Planctomycetota bacterium]